MTAPAPAPLKDLSRGIVHHRRAADSAPCRGPGVGKDVGCELTVATFNLWGLNEPWTYAEQRGEVRGAAAGSLATRLRVPGGAWTRRRPLMAQALAEVRADVVGLQEDRQDLGSAEGGSQSAQLAADLGYA